MLRHQPRETLGQRKKAQSKKVKDRRARERKRERVRESALGTITFSPSLLLSREYEGEGGANKDFSAALRQGRGGGGIFNWIV